MKKLSVLGITVLSVLTLSACSSVGDNNVKVTDNSKTSESTVQSETKATTDSSAKESTTSEVGKRSNPVPLGQTATFDTNFYGDDGKEYDANLSLTLSNVVRGEEAMTYLVNANQFNEPAPEGNEWIIFQIDETLNKGDADVPYFESGHFTVIDSKGAELDQSTYGTFADGESWGLSDMYDGASISGKYAIYAPVGEDVLVEYTGNSFDTSVFFALK